MRRSRNFRDHRHDPEGCDLIVCWEHDWPDAPVEVLGLKSAVVGLRGWGSVDPALHARTMRRAILSPSERKQA